MTLLARIPGSVPNQQLLVGLAQRPDGQWTICLRQQQWAEGIGWYDQKVMHLEPAQWRGLAQLIGNGGAIPEVEVPEQPACLPLPLPDEGTDGRRSAVRGA